MFKVIPRPIIRRVRLPVSFGMGTFPPEKVISPYTLSVISQKRFVEQSQIFTKIIEANKSQEAWRKYPLAKRKGLVGQFVESVLASKKSLYTVLATSIGKCIKDIDGEYASVEGVYKKLIECADEVVRDVVIEDSPQKLIKYSVEPIGMVLMFPYYAEPIRDSLLNLIPALVAGNSILMKSPPNYPQLAQYLSEKLLRVVPLPNLLSDLYIHSSQTPELVKFRQIRQITFTGSHSSGKHIFELVARERFIDCNLFFGSKDAAYIDETADIDLAVREIVKASFSNSGQSLGALKRLYAKEDIAEEVITKIVALVGGLKLGNPLDPGVDMGPLCLQENVLEIAHLIQEAVLEGAQCHTGGTVTTDSRTKGNFIEPTVLSRCESNMGIVQTALQGPVLCCTAVSSVEEFLVELNSNVYGVGVRVFTRDPKRYEKHVKDMHLGVVAFNRAEFVEANLPVEGWRRSGKGKYLSALAYEEYVKYKSCYVTKQ